MKSFKRVADGVAQTDTKMTIKELWGPKETLKLPYNSVADLEAAIPRLNLLDLQKLAVELGVKPCGDRPRLSRAVKDKYIKLTKTYAGARRNYDVSDEPIDPSQY